MEKIEMGYESDWSKDSKALLNAFLDRNDEAVNESVDRLGSLRSMISLTALLAILLRDELGAVVTVEQISTCSEKIVADANPKPRRIVVESVLRTCFELEHNLSGLPEDQISDAIVAALRWACRDFDTQERDWVETVDRAAGSARQGLLLVDGPTEQEGT